MAVIAMAAGIAAAWADAFMIQSCGGVIYAAIAAAIASTIAISASGAAQIAMISAQKYNPIYHEGSWDVPTTGPAILEGREIVVNRSLADSVRSGDAYIGKGSAGGDVNVNVYGHVLDGRGLVKTIKDAFGSNNIRFKTSGAY